jgi:hypothetical protein
MPEADIVAAVHSRGVSFALAQTFEDNLRLAIGSIDLLKQIQDSPKNPVTSPVDAANAKLLAQEASFIRGEDYRNAFSPIFPES